jgi:hypothetical protein
VAYSREIVRVAAKLAQQNEQWADDPAIQALKFSDGWITEFLRRANFRRRKITTETKSLPTVEEVAEIMGRGQVQFIASEHTIYTVYNMDETAYTYAIGPTHLFCPASAYRAATPIGSSTKLRITAVVTVRADGAFPPLMVIIKHSVSSAARPDQTRMRVIASLHKEPGFTAEDGWEMRVWERTLTLKDKKGNLVTAGHKCNYLIHRETGHVITSQTIVTT